MVGRPRGGGGRNEIALTIGFAEGTKAATERPIELADINEPPEGDANDAAIESPEAPRPTPPPVEPQSPQSSPAQAASPASLDAPVDESQATEQRSTARPSASGTTFTPQLADPNDKLAPYATILNSRRAMRTAAAAPAAVAYVPNQVEALTPPPVDPRQQRYDQIVDDFIEYDVGRLRGAAGQKARRRFSELSSDALPALVRGLNKSANIHATCPVGVIASKVLLTIKRAGDPALRQYAIDNIGRGVSPNAPHYERIMALKNRWLGNAPMPKSVETYVGRVESRAQGELMELMLALSKSTSDTVIASIDSGDDFLAAAATLSVIQGRSDWSREQKRQVLTAVNRLAVQARREQLRELAREAQRTLRRN